MPARVWDRRLLTRFFAGIGLATLLVAFVAGGLAWSRSSRASRQEKIARAKRYLEEGQPGLALRMVRPVVDADPNAGDALAVAGIALAALDQRAASRNVLERALKRDPKQPMAHKVVAAIYLSTGDYERGLMHLRAAADLQPTDARPWIAMGKAYHDLGRDTEAADSYETAMKREPGGREARLGFIAAVLKIKRPDRATPQLVEALGESPEDPHVLGLAARHADALGFPEQAAGFASRALAYDPDNFDALVARATSRLLIGETKSARDDLERAVAVKPISVEAIRLLGQLEARLGLTDRARKTMERAKSIEERFLAFDRLTTAIAQRPDDPEPRWRMGQIAAEANMLEIAGNSFQAALAIDPNCQPARRGLTALKVGRGKAPASR